MARTKHMDQFYVALGKGGGFYTNHLEQHFFNNLSKWKISGGASKSEAKEAIQEAVDALEVYNQLKLPEAMLKREIFNNMCRAKNRNLPPPSSSISKRINDMKLLRAQFNVLTRKFMLLDYWQAVATGDAEPDLPNDGAHWALHFFLNFDPMKVRPVLELMLDDANNVLRRRAWDATLTTWAGMDSEKNLTFDRDAISMTLKADAVARIGAQINGTFTAEYKGLKLKAEAEAFAGARAKAEGSVQLSKDMNTNLEVKGSVEVDVGIRITSKVNVNVFDVLEAEAGIDGIAGAMAKAEVEVTANYQGVAMKVGAEAFAGAKITGNAKGTFKLGGREIFTAKAEGSASVGVGANASANFECSVFGKVSMGAKAGATLGVGLDGGGEVAVDFHNIAWGATNAFWLMLNEAGFKNKGKKWFLPVEENVQMCTLTRDQLFKMMGELYRKNEEHATALEHWDVLERRVNAVPRVPVTNRWG